MTTQTWADLSSLAHRCGAQHRKTGHSTSDGRKYGAHCPLPEHVCEADAQDGLINGLLLEGGGKLPDEPTAEARRRALAGVYAQQRTVATVPSYRDTGRYGIGGVRILSMSESAIRRRLEAQADIMRLDRLEVLEEKVAILYSLPLELREVALQARAGEGPAWAPDGTVKGAAYNRFTWLLRRAEREVVRIMEDRGFFGSKGGKPKPRPWAPARSYLSTRVSLPLSNPPRAQERLQERPTTCPGCGAALRPGYGCEAAIGDCGAADVVRLNSLGTLSIDAREAAIAARPALAALLN